MTNAKARILKLVMPLSTKLGNMKPLMPIVRRNKVGPISAGTTNHNEILLLRESSLSFDHRHNEYLQARRAVLSSYHLMNGGDDSLKKKMKSSLKGLQTRVGVRVYRFTVACPWNITSGKVIVFRCFLPHFKA